MTKPEWPPPVLQTNNGFRGYYVMELFFLNPIKRTIALTNIITPVPLVSLFTKCFEIIDFCYVDMMILHNASLIIEYLKKVW